MDVSTPHASRWQSARPLPAEMGLNRSQWGARRPTTERSDAFRTVLQREVQRAAAPLRMSSHALARLAAAERTMSPQDMARLQNGVERAAAKGSREALVLMDDLAFVVSVKNRTVITAVDAQRMKHNVFTGIDSAVIA